MISNSKSVEENKEYLRSIIGMNKRNEIYWMNSVGKEIEYIYEWFGEFSKGVLKIDKYNPKTQKAYFKGYEKGIRVDNLTKCKLGAMLGFQSSKFKYEIGVSINNLIIIDRKYKKDKRGQNLKYYKYKCNKCGNEDWIVESNLKRGNGCNICCNPPRKVVLGINTIWDKARWMVDLGVSEEDAKTYAPCSNKKVKVCCPDCKRTKEIKLPKIYERHSIGCSCGDGVSYPEKLMESVLIQLNVEYERQYKIDKFKYDFYLPKYNTIIEVHGGQHGQFIKNDELILVKRGKVFGFSKRDEIEIDTNKCWMAYKSGIEYYIPIDSGISELQYIKSNIINSGLNKLLDLNKVNWIKCEEYALKNKVKEICDYYKKHTGIFTSDLAKEFGMHRSTITNYLKQGTKLGWCEYDAKEEARRNSTRNGEFNAKRTRKLVLQFTLEGEFIKKYPSISEAGKQTGINIGNISACCNGNQKIAGGYVWKFVE